MLKLAIDAGHGKYTPGKRVPLAMGYGDISEWELNDRVVRYIIADLKTYEGVDILRVDDPTGETDVPLKTRTDKANKWGADFYGSVHHNAFKSEPWNGGGITVYIHPISSKMSKDFQKALYAELIKETGLKGNRATGVPTANFHVLRESKMPAVLSENGYMDSIVDIKIITTDKFARQVAKAHVSTYVKMFNLKKKGGTTQVTYYKQGDKGNGVKQLQSDLIKLGFTVGRYGADGSFGPDTDRAVRDFQKANKLTVDGSAGPATLAKIKELLTPKPAPTPPATSKGGFYRVVAGSYQDKKNAEAQMDKLKKLGVDGVFLVYYEK